MAAQAWLVVDFVASPPVTGMMWISSMMSNASCLTSGEISRFMEESCVVLIIPRPPRSTRQMDSTESLASALVADTAASNAITWKITTRISALNHMRKMKYPVALVPVVQAHD